MATKNNRRTVMTKRILKETLLELMQKKKISKITIKEICELSDMSRSTFYLHYQDQFQLLDEIEQDILHDTFEKLKYLDSAPNTRDSIETFLKYVKDNSETFGVIFCQVENVNFQQKMMESVQSYVKSTLSDLQINSYTEKYLYTFIMNGSLNVIRTWIINGFDCSEEMIANIIYHSCNNIANFQFCDRNC